jgi:hypothetical protein
VSLCVVLSHAKCGTRRAWVHPNAFATAMNNSGGWGGVTNNHLVGGGGDSRINWSTDVSICVRSEVIKQIRRYAKSTYMPTHHPPEMVMQPARRGCAAKRSSRRFSLSLSVCARSHFICIRDSRLKYFVERVNCTVNSLPYF